MMESEFLKAVYEERQYQRMRWTDPHDDQHTALEWGGLLARYVGRAVECALTDNQPLYRTALIVLAAVAFAAYEAEYRKSKSFVKDPENPVP
jgi:hypothetical protein